MLRGQFNVPALRSKLNRIASEVHEHLLKARDIGPDNQVGLRLRKDLGFFVRQWSQRGKHFCKRRFNRYVLNCQIQSTGLYFGKIKNITDEVKQMLATCVYIADIASLTLI